MRRGIVLLSVLFCMMSFSHGDELKELKTLQELKTGRMTGMALTAAGATTAILSVTAAEPAVTPLLLSGLATAGIGCNQFFKNYKKIQERNN